MSSNTPSPRVSIIIPVYNSEAFLAATLDSVLAQTYTNFELILINDGSTDGTGAVIDRYVARDARIVARTTVNQGPSKARMEGLAVERGEFVYFFDSDDTMLPDAVESLLAVADATGADMVLPKIIFNQIDGRSSESFGLTAPVVSGHEYLREVLSGRGYWSLLILVRRTLIDSISDWSEGMRLGEDVIWKTQLLLGTERVAGVDRPCMIYNERAESLSHDVVRNKEKFRDFQRYVAWLKNCITAHGLDDYMEEAMARFHVMNVCQQLSWRFVDGVAEELMEICRDMDKYPDIINTAGRSRYRKLIRAFRFARWYGLLKLRFYIAIDKL